MDSAKKIGLSKLKSHVDKLDKDKFKKVPNGFSSSKSKVDNLNFRKLETTPVDLSKLRNVVKFMSLKRLNMINWLKKLILFRLTTDTSNLVKKKTDYNIKINEIEEKVNQHDHSNKCITTKEFNKLTSQNFTAR